MTTSKQKAVAAKITENHGNISKTMREVGYAENTAKKPSNLTNSKGWQELMEKNIPDSLLLRKHKELLNKTEVIYSKEGELIREDIDAQAVSKGLDMGYKLKGRYAPQESNVHLDDKLPDTDITQLADEASKLLKDKKL